MMKTGLAAIQYGLDPRNRSVLYVKVVARVTYKKWWKYATNSAPQVHWR